MKLDRIARLSVPLLMVVALVCSPDARASGIYVQAEINRTFVDEHVDVSNVGFRLDGKASGLRFAVGYDFNRYVSLEAGIIDFGKVSRTLFGRDVFADADGKEIGVIGRLPLGRSVALIGRFGTVWWDGDIGIDAASIGLSDRDQYVGAGIEFRPDERFAVGLIASKYRFDDLDFGTAALSLKFRF